MPPLAGWARTIDLALVLLLGLPGRRSGSVAGRWRSWPGPTSAGPSGTPTRASPTTTVLDHYECPQGELLTLQTFDDRDKLAIYKAPGLELQRVRPQGILHAARRGAARLPLAGRVPRDRRRPLPPLALPDHPGHLGALRPRRYDRLAGQARRALPPRRGVHQPGAPLERPPRLPSDADEAARPRGLGGRGDGRPLRIAASRVRDGPSSPTRNRPWPIPAQSSTDREEHGYRRLDEHPENSSARPNGRRDSPIQG